MPTINRKLLLFSVLGSSLLVVLVHGLWLFQIGRHGGFYTNQARNAAERRDFATAIQFYQRAIALNPTSFECYSELSDSLEATGNLKGAYSTAQRAEQIKNGDDSNDRRLARLALSLERFDDAERRNKLLLSRNSNDSVLLLALARSQSGRKDYAAAAGTYRQVIATDSAPIESFLELAEILSTNMREQSAARAAIDQLIEVRAKDPLAWIAHGTWFLSQFVKKSITADAASMPAVAEYLEFSKHDSTTALELSSRSAEALEFAARVAATDNQFDEALLLAEEGIEKHGVQESFFALAASSSQQLKNRADAEAWLQKGLARFPNSKELLWELANVQLEKRDFPAGRQSLTRMLSAGQPASLVRFFEARLLAAEGKFSDAIVALESVRSQLVDAPEFQRVVDFELANCFGSIGDRDKQIVALRRAVAQNSGWLAGREQLAMALLGAGRIDEATEEYRNITVRTGVPIGAPLNLARLLIIQNLSRDESRRDWAPIENILKAVEEKLTADIEVAILRAEMLLAQNRIDEAVAVLESKPASDDRILSSRLLLQANQKNWSAADALFDSAKSQGLDSVELRRAKAIRLVSENTPESNVALVELVRLPENWDSPRTLELNKTLLPIVMLTEETTLAESIANRIIELDPSDLNARLSLLDTYRRLKNSDGMKRVLAEVAELSGKTAIWHFGQAILAVMNPDGTPITESQNQLAQSHLAEATVLRPEWADIPAFSGTLYDVLKNEESTVVKYSQAVDLGWRRLSTIQRLLSLLAKRGRYGEADAVIRQVSKASPTLSSSMSRMASEISLQMANVQRAIVQAEDAAKESTSAEDYLWLAQLRDIARDVDGTETAYRKALEIDPANPIAQMSWVRFLGRTARVDEAKKSLIELEKRLNLTEPGQALMLAECFAALSMNDDIRRITIGINESQINSINEYNRYYNLLSQYESTERKQSFLQERIAQPMASKRPEVARWAKRQLALEWMNKGSIIQYQQAEKYLIENLQADAQSIDDRRAMAILMAVWHSNDDPKRALKLYEDLLKDNWEPEAEDAFMLGQLYVLAGDWTRGSKFFLQLLGNKERRQPRYLQKYAQLLLAKKDPKEAELWVDLLRKDGAQDIETAELLTEVRYQRGQFDQLARNLIGSNSGETESAWYAATVPTRKRFEMLTAMITRLVADSRNDIAEKYQTAAEEMGKKLEESQDFPGAFFATQLLARGQTTKAVAALERVMNSSTEAELTAFGDDILQRENVGAADLEKLESIYAALAAKEPQKDVYRVLEARLRELRGDFSGAEKVYRTLIASNPSNDVALNNLANLLALQKIKLEEALTLIQRVIDEKGATPFLLDTRGMVFLGSNRLAEAVQDFEKAVSEFPHPQLRFHLAWSYSVVGKNTDVRLQLDRALKDGLMQSQLHVLERPIWEKLNRLP